MIDALIHFRETASTLTKTDLVVSMTKVSGGLMMSSPTDTGQDMQLQATHRPLSPGQSESEVQVQPSLRQGSAGRSLKRKCCCWSKEEWTFPVRSLPSVDSWGWSFYWWWRHQSQLAFLHAVNCCNFHNGLIWTSSAVQSAEPDLGPKWSIQNSSFKIDFINRRLERHIEHDKWDKNVVVSASNSVQFDSNRD